MKPMLVGESNPFGADPRYALFPEPEHASGGRLCRLVMGLERRVYMRDFDRANLCVGKWSAPAARARAQALCDDGEHEVFVLLGVKVAGAFLPGKPKLFTIEEHCSGRFVVLPHPSGINRVWADPAAFGRARALLVEAGVLS